jgi:hypothetical protein
MVLDVHNASLRTVLKLLWQIRLNLHELGYTVTTRLRHQECTLQSSQQVMHRENSQPAYADLASFSTMNVGHHQSDLIFGVCLVGRQHP